MMSPGHFLTRRARFLLAWAVVVVSGGTAMLIADQAYRRLPHPEPMEELSYYPSGQHLKWATFGHPETAADLAWLRAVQYYGEHRASDNRFAKMRHIFDILTSLAPDFKPAYVFGAFALAQEGRDFSGAERLMLKGIEANPTSGWLAFELGFLYFVRPGGRALEQAAEYFTQASRQSDAPPSSARFAAYTRQHSGHLQLAYELWQNVYQTSPNRYLRETAHREMQRIQRAIQSGQDSVAVRKLDTPRVLLEGS